MKKNIIVILSSLLVVTIAATSFYFYKENQKEEANEEMAMEYKDDCNTAIAQVASTTETLLGDTIVSFDSSSNQVLITKFDDGTVYSAPEIVNDLFNNQDHNFDGVYVDGIILWIDKRTGIVYNSNGSID